MMTLILDVGRSMKWMMTLNLCLIPLKKILEINYTYGYLTQPMAKEILWRVTVFLFLREWMREGFIQSKKKMTREKKYWKGNEGVYFGESCN